MPGVRAKFQVTKIEKNFYRSGDHVNLGGVKVTLTPQYDNTIEEDRRFAKATPSGLIEMFIDNPIASDYLEPGQNFYVDFTKIE